jgi:Ca2+-binding RTX toxin-like protein
MPNVRHRLALATVTVTAGILAGLVLPELAQALTDKPVWKCRASASYLVLDGGDRAEPIVANGNVNTARGADPDQALCGADQAGGDNLPAPLGIPTDLLAARTASAITSIVPELGGARDQKVTATARVENLTLRIPEGGAVVVGVAFAESHASGTCAGAVPQLAGSSQILGLTVNGAPVSTTGLGAALRAALSALQPLVTIRTDETIRTANALIVRALHVVVKLGSATIVEAVIAESKVGIDGNVCGAGGGPLVCPRGTIYVASQNLCVIPASESGGANNDIIVGSPAQIGSGGAIVALRVAQRRYRSPCLAGSSPKWVRIGTNANDVLHGSPGRDRMLAFGGRDGLVGERGDDCLDGGAGRDSVNGGSGNDTLVGGSGNDTINAGNGADRIFGGPGDDKINVSAAGPRATVHCGSGYDVVRYNNSERKLIHECERRGT